MQTERATSDDEVGRPWKRIAWAVVILVIVLTYALNAMTRDAANKAAIERVRTLLRARVPHLDEDRHMAPDMAAAAELVRAGAIVEAARLPMPEVWS